ncbi:MAG TPA: type I restriction-modification enzyme R subunit C-terminal domain-containing protein [Verrucomicrobiae bacterium]|nr:type I restriction-modification enzyme R subunit C-terminal domain-containing protein [Verrucomicrobiae bacterium]
MRAALHKANEDLAQQYPHYVARVTADEGKVGRGHLDDFVDPERDMPVILTTSKLLSTGVDAPTCRNIVLFKPIGSIVEFKQIIGRGTRLYPDKDKLWFTILDYAGATRLFADPNFDGEPERTTEERIYPSSEEQGPPAMVGEGPSHGREEDEDVPVGDWQEQLHRKYYVDGVEVRITAEVVYELDSSGKKQRVVKYTDYAAEQVRRLCPTPAELRTEWMDAEHRGAIQQALSERGIDFSTLVEATHQPDADPFDLLIHVAWNAPLRTRRERVERVRRERKDFWDLYTPQARAVLNDLLDKYTDYGVTQLDDLQILEVPPLSERGTPMEIAGFFGGVDHLRSAVAELQSILYK